MSTYSNGNPKNFSKTDAYLEVVSENEVEITSRTVATSALNAGKTVIVADNMTGTLNLTKPTSTAAIDLNGKTISNPTTMFGSAIRVFNRDSQAPSTLTVNGEGTVNGVGSSPYKMAVQSTGAGAKIVINSGTYTNASVNAADDDQYDLIYASEGGQIEINGGTFICATPKWTLNLQDNSGSSIVVKGGTFFEFDPSNATTEPGTITNYVADGYKVETSTDESGTWYTVVPA